MLNVRMVQFEARKTEEQSESGLPNPQRPHEYRRAAWCDIRERKHPRRGAEFADTVGRPPAPGLKATGRAIIMVADGTGLLPAGFGLPGRLDLFVWSGGIPGRWRLLYRQLGLPGR